MTSALVRLQSSLDRIKDVVDDMDTRILNSSGGVRIRDETLRCSCTVILSGFLENFLREISEAYISTLCLRSVPFSQLPPKTKQRHFVEGGKLLGLKYQNHGKASWVNADYQDMVQRLSSPAMSPNSYNLLWEAYATTQGNPGPNVIEDILNHLGIDKCSTQLNSALSGHYSTDKLALQSYIDIRNECAHTGSAINVPSTSDIREFCSSIYRIASAVVSVLEVRLGQSPFGTNLNTANFSELENIPGLGPVRIMALINFRNANGRFNRLQDISQVPGFGQKLIKSLRMYIYTS